MPPTSLSRILDASLNRAGEGLRVVEDFLRFVLDDAHLTQLAKSLRHDLTEATRMFSSYDRNVARDTLQDVGTELTTHGEQQRTGPWDVCVASLKRVEQSLRSLEEYGKLIDEAMGPRMEALRYRVYTLEKAMTITQHSCAKLTEVRLCVLVEGGDSEHLFEQLVTSLVEAGVGMIQLREKRLEDRRLIARAHRLREITQPTETLAIINDRPDIAMQTRADGVHVGQDDLSVKDARAMIGTQMLLGVSTHTLEQAHAAVLAGANYLGAGPTFPSQTKSFATFPGLEFLREMAAEIRLPTFAIGGIEASNLGDVLATGITRVAVGGGITKADNPVAKVQEIYSGIDEAAKHSLSSADS